MASDERVRAYVRRREIPTIRQCARALRMRQADVLEAAEGLGLNINIGIQCGSGYATFDHIGDYTLEDLTDGE